MCASLAHPVRDEPVHEANGVSGQAVSSMYKLKDYDNHGTFSCMTPDP